ncbi:MAG TPA: transketolase C-terminal domain-containing protein, partial [Rubricoccaceae bacterium]
TSQGAFHEGLNWAARESLPVIFHIQDNGYAISVPVSEQTAGGSIWTMLGGYPGLTRLKYDGTDLLASLAAAKAAIEHVRAGKGPVALLADVVRLLPHSSSDDHNKYREAESVAADRLRDPIPSLVRRLVEAGVTTDADVEALRLEIHAQIDLAARAVEAEADPDPATATAHVYYEGPDDRVYEADGPTGELVVMVDAVNHALDEEMARDERVLVYGEDVGGGKGGVFTATRGLAEKYGNQRCFNSPLAEHSIVGSAVGFAAAGYMPVVEIQFADYVWPSMQPLRNQVASMRYRSNNAWESPMVIRMPCGGYIHGGLCHSQNVESLFAHWPGVHVVMPSNAADAKGLLKTAIRGRDPVIFLEHKSLYRQGPARSPEPHADFLVPLGKARVVKEGTDLTIVTWGAIVYRSLAAARVLEKEGVSVEVIDVRSMLPLDTETIIASACKTGRVLVAHEDHEFMGFGAEIAAQVSAAAFGHLDAPVRRVAGAFSSIPYADGLEKEVLPQDENVLAAAREVLAF